MVEERRRLSSSFKGAFPFQILDLEALLGAERYLTPVNQFLPSNQACKMFQMSL
jgi:hypothetical protein